MKNDVHKSDQQEAPVIKENEVDISCQETNISHMECDEAQKKCEQLELQKSDNDEANISCDQLESPNTEKNVRKDLNKSEKIKSVSDNSDENIDEVTVNKIEHNEGKDKAITEITKSEKIKCVSVNSNQNIDDITVNKMKENEWKDESLKEIKHAGSTESESNQIKDIDKRIDQTAVNQIKKDLDKKDAKAEINQDALTVYESDNFDCNDKTNEKNVADESKEEQGEYETFPEVKEAPNENDDSSNSDDDDWEDIFDAVGEELTAAQNKIEKVSSESGKKSKKDGDCLLEDDIYDEHDALDYSVDSDDELLEDTEEGDDDLDGEENVLDLDVETNEMFEAMETEFHTTEADTDDTITECVQDSKSSIDNKLKKINKGFERKYFMSVLKDAGISIRTKKIVAKHSNITVGILCAIKALDIFTNKQIFAWIKRSKNLIRKMNGYDHIKLAAYREIANFMMNETDIKEKDEWDKFIRNPSFLDYELLPEGDWRRILQSPHGKLTFKYAQNVPTICQTFKIKFNSNYFLSLLLGYDAIKWEFKDGVDHYHLVEIEKVQQFTVGHVLAAKAVDIFSDEDIVNWICKCKNIASVDSLKIHEQLAVYKEFSNYLENDLDERDNEYVSYVLFSTSYFPWKKDVEKANWDACFNTNINLHKRFRDFSCSYDLTNSEKLASMEVVDVVHHDPSEISMLWNDLVLENYDQDQDKKFYDTAFQTNYFKHLLIAKKVTNKGENEKKSYKLNKVEAITVGLVMAALQQQYDKQVIADWIEKSHGTKPSKRQFFMYEILCDHLMNLDCNFETRYWKRLINSVKYQGPVDNCDVWSNVFGKQIPNLLGVTLVGKFEFERLYRGISCYNMDEYKTEFLDCIQLTHDLHTTDSGSTNEKQNPFFDNEYFASLLLNSGARLESSSQLKYVADLTIGQVMAAVIDDGLNEEDIYEWIKQCEVDPCTKKSLQTVNLKSQFLTYKLLASYLMNYSSQNSNDSYLNSWKMFLSSRYVFSNVGDFPLEKSISPQINSIYLSSEWCIDKRYEMKLIVPEIKESLQSKNFEKIKDMIPNMKSIPIFHIVKGKKIFGVKKSFFANQLIKDKVVRNYRLPSASLNIVKPLTVGHILGVFSLGKFRETDIKNWITACLGFNGVIPFGPLKRMLHFLLCEVPKELVNEWAEIMNTRFRYWKESDGLGNLQALLYKKKHLCENIDTFKHNNDYIENECRKFISGNCTKDGCKQYHLCCRKKSCKSSPKAQSNKNSKTDESKSSTATQNETGESLDEDKNEEIGSIQAKYPAGSVHSRLGPPVKSAKELKRRGREKDVSDDEKETKRAKFESERFEKSSNLPAQVDESQSHDENELGSRKASPCMAYNNTGSCPSNTLCCYQHRCDECAGDHSRVNCLAYMLRTGKERGEDDKQEEIPGMCKFYNKTKCGTRPGHCKWPHRCNACGGEHPQFKCSNKQLGSGEKGEDAQPFEISGMCKYFNSTQCTNNYCKWPHRCKACGGDHPQFKCTNRLQDREEEKGEEEKQFEISEMCKYYNKTKCGFRPGHCKWPHRCSACGGEHPQFKCTNCTNKQQGNEELGIHRSQMGISQSHSAVHNRNEHLPMRDESPSWQHQQPSLPKKQVLLPTPSYADVSQSANQFNTPHGSQSTYKSQRLNTSSDSSDNFSVLGVTHILYNMCDHFDDEFKYLCKKTLSKVLEVKHNDDKMIEVFSKHLNVLRGMIDELCEQLETVHDTQTKVLLTKCVSDTKQLLKKAKSVSMNTLKTTPHSERSMNTSTSVKDSLLAGVVKRVAKETMNKDTACIIEHIKKEVQMLGMPATMEIIGKLVVEIAEHQKTNALKGVLSDYYGHSSSSETMYDSAGRADYYGRSSHNDPFNEPSVSGNPSRQNSGGRSNIHPDDTWYESSDHFETPQTTQRSRSQEMRRDERSNIYPEDAWYESSRNMESQKIRKRPRSPEVRREEERWKHSRGRERGRGGSPSEGYNERPVDVNYEQSGWDQRRAMPSQQRSGHNYQSSDSNYQDDTWHERSRNKERSQLPQTSRSKEIRRSGSYSDSFNETALSTDYDQQSWEKQGPEETWYESSQPSKRSDDAWYERADDMSPHSSQRSRGRGMRRGGGDSSQRSRGRGMRRGGDSSLRSRGRGMRRGGGGGGNYGDDIRNPESSHRSRPRFMKRGGRW